MRELTVVTAHGRVAHLLQAHLAQHSRQQRRLARAHLTDHHQQLASQDLRMSQRPISFVPTMSPDPTFFLTACPTMVGRPNCAPEVCIMPQYAIS